MVLSNDKRIWDEVVAKLSADHRLDGSDIEVNVKNGVVKLEGTVRSAAELTRALGDAAIVAGGAKIIDGLVVRVPNRSNLTEDGELKVSLSRMLASEPKIDPSRITVMVQDGRVTLDGSVDASWKKGYVEALVAGWPQVVAIDSTLAVIPSKNAADQATADDLIHVLDRHPLIGSHNLTVRVDEGAVTLSGTASTEIARETARLLATHVFGVVTVRDKIEVVSRAN